jgi:hypothetical protein
MKINVVSRGEDPFFARIIIAETVWNRDISAAREILIGMGDHWPQNKRARIILTCSGFIDFTWPVPDPKIGDGRNPDSVRESLRELAEERCRSLITDEVRERLSRCADFLALGIDSEKYNKLQYPDCWPYHDHIEFVVVIDLRNNRYHWTGKSYPQQEQENGLIRNPDIASHFIDLPPGKTLIFACNDLMLESPRGIAATKEGSFRGKIRQQFRTCLANERPAIALHLAHTTDDPGTWRKSFNHLKDTVPSVEKFSSNGVFPTVDKPDAESRLGKVLAKTTNTDSVDFIVIADTCSLDVMKIVLNQPEPSRVLRGRPHNMSAPSRDLKELLSPGDAEVYAKILAWSEERNLKLYWSPTGTFAPMYADARSDRNNLIAVRPDGTIQLQLKYLFRKDPFTAADNQRELIRKLNSLPGVHISEGQTGGLPAFPMKHIQDTRALEDFLGTLDGVLAKIPKG